MIKNKNIVAIILAAGRGERMKSDLPKILHPICGRPMFYFTMDLIKNLKIDKRILVLGHKYHIVKRFVDRGTKVIIQKRLQGSADAVRETESALRDFKGSLLILYADNPLLKEETIRRLIRHHIDNSLDVTLLAAKVKKPAGYGRILRDKYRSICQIVEEKDADDFQKEIKEINIGCACFNKAKLFKALREVKRNNLKREYYLTDVIKILYRQSARIEAVTLHDLDEGWGVNSLADLAKANKIMQMRILKRHMENGVAVIDPQTAFIDWGVKIGSGTKIYPFTVIESGVKIGKRCFIGPFAHLREDTSLGDDSVAGNFLEIVRSRISSKTLAKHFCYIGDSRIGRNVNIGAGTVTANFDGKKKNISTVKDNAFLGSDTILVAPVKIGKGAITGAGSVVTKNKNVADNTIVAGVPARMIKRG